MTVVLLGWPLLGLIILTSPACQITPPVDTTTAPVEVKAPDPEQLLRRAQGSPPREAAALRLDAVQQLMADGAISRAYELATHIDQSLLTPPRRFVLNRLAARAALEMDRPDDAWRFIQRARPTNDDQGVARDLDLAAIARARNDYVTAAHTLMAIDATADLPAQQLNDDIWDTLRGTPSSRIAALAATSSDPIAGPWWQLAAAMDRGFDVAAQRKALAEWQAQHPDHPAAVTPPRALVQLSQMRSGIHNLGVFLPLSGPLAAAGRAVRDGFMAAYYHADADVTVRLYDTHEAPIDALYEQAMADGIELIIGPLDKGEVTTFHNQAFRQIPVLALNYVATAAPAAADPSNPSNPPAPETTARLDGDFFQFGLAIEDEAGLVAERVEGDGLHRVLLLVADADWAERASDAFLARWTGGPDSRVEVARVYDIRSLTNVVGTALDVDESTARMQAVADAIGERLEFVPRRRHDIDAVVALVGAGQGDAVRPALAYHFASDIPVYATSQITSGRNPSRLGELNSMRICELPWTVFPDPVKQSFANAFRRQQPGPLQALGVDAYRLADRLPLLAEDPHARLLGATGILTLDGSSVRRQLVWAVVRNGQLEPLPIVVN